MISTPSSASKAPSQARPRLTSSRSRAPRLRLALTWLFVLACLTTTVLAQSETYATSLQHRRHHVATINRYELHRRGESSKDEDDDDEEPDKITNPEAPAKDGSSTTTTATKTKATASTVTIQRTAQTAASTNSPLPQAFDGNLAAELTTTSDSNCPSFLNGILADPSFEACYPLSMMLQTSRGFFDAQKQLLSIVRVLDQTCAANVTYCTEFFDAAAQNLTSADNCKKEWDAGNSIVKQFLYGMKTYEMMYKATCLQTPDDDMYCYANAVTNTSTASNAYFYYLPYNLTLPGSTNPSCSWCIQETMNIFHAAAEDRSQPIALTYETAARQVNTLCGMDFVNGTLPPEETNAAHSFGPSWVGLMATLAGAALVNVLL
ncbi:hypothetical protein CDV31_007176 [Fusarium ambrosium]|uniref:DUF7729 domain-containing protein n=1 Tax=Fusarium ambrosium TaxID=131363 RepID=A0A428U8F0_9HYPO|nr:hypothetical protein CDV31_007176 [Fusarium ambrosium]